MNQLQSGVFAVGVALLLSQEAACMDRVDSEQTFSGRTAAEIFHAPATANLAKAACVGNEGAISQALASGAGSNDQGEFGLTPLSWALYCENEVGVRRLLEAGSDPNVRISGIPGKPTVVVMAAKYPEHTFLKDILLHGGDPDAFYLETSTTSLIAAATLGIKTDDWRNYNALIEAGANINMIHHNKTVGEWLAAFFRFDKVNELLDRGYCVKLDRVSILLDPTEIPDGQKNQERWIPEIERKIAASKGC